MLNRAVQSVREEYFGVFGRPVDGLLFFMGWAEQLRFQGYAPQLFGHLLLLLRLHGYAPRNSWNDYIQGLINEKVTQKFQIERSVHRQLRDVALTS